MCFLYIFWMLSKLLFYNNFKSQKEDIRFMKKKVFLSLVSLALLTGAGLASCKETSSTPVAVNALTDEMLSQAAKGYSSENLVKVDYEMTGAESFTMQNYIDVEADSDTYHVISYTASEDGAPQKEEVDFDEYYQPVTEGDVVLAGSNYIGLGNTVETQAIDGLKWQESFSNFFAGLKSDDFLNAAEQYHFTLDLEGVSAELKNAVATQAIGGYGFALKSLEVVTDGFKIVGYAFASEPYDVEGLGSMTVTVTATVNELGEDVVTPLEVYTGETDADFDTAMESLQAGNYQVTETFSVDVGSGLQPLSAMNAEVSNGVLVDLDTDDIMVERDGALHNVIQLSNDMYYKSGYFLDGCGLPDFNISSVFFDKGTDGTYTLDLTTYPSLLASLSAFDPFDTGSVTSLTVSISETEITFTADSVYLYSGYSLPSQYVVSFTSIGGVEDFGLDIPEEIDYVRFDEYFNNYYQLKANLGLADCTDDEADQIVHEIPIPLYYGDCGVYTLQDDSALLGTNFTVSTDDDVNTYLNLILNLDFSMFMDCGYEVDTENLIATKTVEVGENSYDITLEFIYATTSSTGTDYTAGVMISITKK